MGCRPRLFEGLGEALGCLAPDRGHLWVETTPTTDGPCRVGDQRASVHSTVGRNGGHQRGSSPVWSSTQHGGPDAVTVTNGHGQLAQAVPVYPVDHRHDDPVHGGRREFVSAP
ncbi:uncharacterized protein METZ01_LOCUS514654 [marine metagenome]|uniref:Uncharacterized protein n=1 Tax=marine metagenome TaxID=408172 RepID=A0A383EZY1_9ZZZZ